MALVLVCTQACEVIGSFFTPVFRNETMRYVLNILAGGFNIYVVRMTGKSLPDRLDSIKEQHLRVKHIPSNLHSG
jgi:hypothetical protein